MVSSAEGHSSPVLTTGQGEAGGEHPASLKHRIVVEDRLEDFSLAESHHSKALPNSQI